MTNDVSTTLPPALSRALDLLIDPPAEPDVSNGYLDLLGTTADDAAKNSGAIQAAWASPIGSFVLRQPAGVDPTVHRRMATADRLAGRPARRRRPGRRLRPRIRHHLAGPCRRTRRAGAGCRHLRADAGPRGAGGGGSAGRVLARGRAATPVAGQHCRRRGVDSGVAADPRSGGDGVRDRPGAQAGWSTGGDGSHPASSG